MCWGRSITFLSPWTKQTPKWPYKVKHHQPNTRKWYGVNDAFTVLSYVDSLRRENYMYITIALCLLWIFNRHILSVITFNIIYYRPTYWSCFKVSTSTRSDTMTVCCASSCCCSASYSFESLILFQGAIEPWGIRSWKSALCQTSIMKMTLLWREWANTTPHCPALPHTAALSFPKPISAIKNPHRTFEEKHFRMRGIQNGRAVLQW